MQKMKKERVKVCFFLSFSPYSFFGLNLRHVVMPHMCCEMQNKLSKTRVSPFGSKGLIISSRCPFARTAGESLAKRVTRNCQNEPAWAQQNMQLGMSSWRRLKSACTCTQPLMSLMAV